MSVIRCEYCKTPMEWLATTFGKRLPFEHDLVDLGQLAGRDGWVIIRKNGRALAAPMDHVGRQTAAGVRRVLVTHTCEAYLKTKATPPDARAPQSTR